MQTGTIKTLKTGFGFIVKDGAAAGDKDLFFHAEKLNGVRFDELKEGDKVTFEVIQTDRGAAADKVSRA